MLNSIGKGTLGQFSDWTASMFDMEDIIENEMEVK